MYRVTEQKTLTAILDIVDPYAECCEEGESTDDLSFIYRSMFPHATSCIERALSAKMNNDRADGHCYSFDWI